MTGTICDDCGFCNGFDNEYKAETVLEKEPFCPNCGGELRIGEITARQDEGGEMG